METLVSVATLNPSTAPLMHTPSYPVASRKDRSLTESLHSMLDAILLYADARLRLLWMEGKGMARLGLVVAALGVFSAMSIIIAYFGSMAALVIWIARTWWSGDMLPALLIVASGHLVAAVACMVSVFYATRKTNPFNVTLKEFKEDKQWLHINQTSKN